jgi:hypothetical protein
VASSFPDPPRKTAYGIAGLPIPPVALDGRAWTGDSLCLTDWLRAETLGSYRAVIARGDFIRALVDETGGEPGIVLERVTVQALPDNERPGRDAPEWQRAPAPWSHPTGFEGSVLDRIWKTRAEFHHELPGPADSARLETVFEHVEQRYGGRLDRKLAELLLKSNGPSLFDGMLTFFPIDPRTDENPVPERSHSVPSEDLVSANERVGNDDWRLSRPGSSILFAARFGESHSFWALCPEDRVRLLMQTGEVLGPGIPFEAWLEDQVADLEWIWGKRNDLTFNQHGWLHPSPEK